MSVLVIGSGLIGSQITKQLVDEGVRPYVLELRPQLEAIERIVSPKDFHLVTGDIVDLEFLRHFIQTNDVRCVINTAANPMLTVGANEKPYEAIRLNIMGMVNVLEVARKQDLECVVFTSSSVLYSFRRGGLESGELSEDNYPRPTTIYASTKLSCENLGLNYAESYGLNFIALRLAAVFGPWKGLGGGGPSMMFKQAVEKSLGGEPATISPRTMELVYSKDVARSAMLAMRAKDLKNRVYNVGMGRIYSPLEIVSILTDKIPSAKITVEEFEIGNPTMTTEGPLNLRRSREEIGYEPRYNMRRAIDDYVEFSRKYIQ